MIKRMLLLLFIGLVWGQSRIDINNLVDRDGLLYAPNKEKPFTGSVFDLHDNGQKKLNGRYRNGLKNGRWAWWNQDGGTDSTGSYRKGLMNGPWQYYFINGNPKAKGFYKEGNGTDRDQKGLPRHGRNGKWTFWYDDGLKHIEITYKNGTELKRKIIFEKIFTAVQLLEMSDNNLKTNDIDAAVGDLNSLISKYPEDSLAALAQYKLSTIHLNWNNDLSSGFEALQHTVDNYPNSVQAAQAKKEIENFPDFILNNVESLRKRKMIKEALDYLVYMTDKHPHHVLTPKGQYIIGDIYMNDLRDFETAILSYRKVIDDYAGSSQEPNAQFMIGFVFANILNDYKSAEIEYKIFLENFPNHELAPSIRFELENLGKSIDEIPALKYIAN